MTVACEPAGHRWRVLDQLAADRGLALVCAQPLLACRAREGEDLIFGKPDPMDAVIIVRLAAGLHCYQPERADAAWRGCGTWVPAACSWPVTRPGR